MDRAIKADLYRYGGLTGIKGFIKGWLSCHGFRYTFFYRKVEKYRRTTIKGICYRILKRLFIYRGFHISQGAELGEGFYFNHRGTVIIGPVKIGKNCCVGHNVVIGRAYKNGVLGRPTLGDNVWIGTGSVLVGEIKIGNNVLIAPLTFVNFDVPDNSIVIGSPGKITRKENPTKYYITNVLNE
jgi:serine O-acetyltransferase